MGIEPARGAGQQRGDQEDDYLGALGIDAHCFGHHDTAAQGANRPALARVEQIADGDDGEQHDEPDQVVKLVAGLQFPTEQRYGGDARYASVAAEEFDVAEQEIQADAPGNSAERQVVATHAQRDKAEEERDGGGDGQSDEQREPG